MGVVPWLTEMSHDQRVRSAADARSGLGTKMEDEEGSTVPSMSLSSGSDGDRKSGRTGIRWEKVQGARLSGIDDVAGSSSYGTFVGLSSKPLEAPSTAWLPEFRWKVISLVALFGVMGVLKWYGLGLGGKCAFCRFYVKMKELAIIHLAVKVSVLIFCVAIISILGSVLGLPQASPNSSQTRRSSLIPSGFQNS